MKTLINITAHAAQGGWKSHPETTYSFIRPASAKSPTYRGAERMVAKRIGAKPSEVSVMRIEAMCYDCK